MKTIRTLLCTILFSALLGASAFAAGGDSGVPPMNFAGLLLLGVAIAAMALAVGVIVQYVQKFRDINREEQRRLQNRKKK